MKTLECKTPLLHQQKPNDCVLHFSAVCQEENLTIVNGSGVDTEKCKAHDSVTAQFLGFRHQLLPTKTEAGKQQRVVLTVDSLPTAPGRLTIQVDGETRTIMVTPGVHHTKKITITKPASVAGAVTLAIRHITRSNRRTIPLNTREHNTTAKVAAAIVNFLAEHPVNSYTVALDPSDSSSIIITCLEKIDKGWSDQVLLNGAGVASIQTLLAEGSAPDTINSIIGKIENAGFPAYVNVKKNSVEIIPRILKATFTVPVVDTGATGMAIGVSSREDQTTRNILTQDDFAESDTLFEVRSDFDLDGATIQLPLNAGIIFNGGTLSNGTLIGDDTVLESISLTKIFGEDINFLGSFKVNGVYPEWFGAISKVYDHCMGNNVAVRPPRSIDLLPDSANAFNKAFELSVLAGSKVCVNGALYKLEKTIRIPRGAVLETDIKTILFFYLHGKGCNISTYDEDMGTIMTTTSERAEQISSLLPNQFIPTTEMEMALVTDSMDCVLEGNGTISLVKSSYTIGIYCRGDNYLRRDKVQGSPVLQIRIVGGEESSLAPDVRDLKGEGAPRSSAFSKEGQYYFDKIDKKYYLYHHGTWVSARESGIPDQANSLYNTSVRFEGDFEDCQTISPNIHIGDTYGFRGIEIIVASDGWLNNARFRGTISNKHGSFVSIFNQAGRTDWYNFSDLSHCVDGTLGYDARIYYFDHSRGIKTGKVWDLDWTGAKRGHITSELATEAKITGNIPYQIAL